MDRLVDHLFVFEGDGKVIDFPGNYTQYRLDERTKEGQKQTSDSTDYKQQPAVIHQPKAALDNKRKVGYKERREFEVLEKEIADLETEKQQLESQLGDSNASYEQISTWSHRIGILSHEISTKEMRWLELSEIM